MLTISNNKTINGQIDDDVTVENGGVLTLNGQITKNLFVELGGTAIINGMLIGNLINRGQISIHGMVLGSISNLAA